MANWAGGGAAGGDDPQPEGGGSVPADRERRRARRGARRRMHRTRAGVRGGRRRARRVARSVQRYRGRATYLRLRARRASVGHARAWSCLQLASSEMLTTTPMSLNLSFELNLMLMKMLRVYTLLN